MAFLVISNLKLLKYEKAPLTVMSLLQQEVLQLSFFRTSFCAELPLSSVILLPNSKNYCSLECIRSLNTAL